MYEKHLKQSIASAFMCEYVRKCLLIVLDFVFPSLISRRRKNLRAHSIPMYVIEQLTVKLIDGKMCAKCIV